MGCDDQRLFPGDRDYRSVDPRRKHVRSGSLLWWRASDCGDAFATRSWPGGADVALGLHALIGCMAFGAIILVPVPDAVPITRPSKRGAVILSMGIRFSNGLESGGINWTGKSFSIDAETIGIAWPRGIEIYMGLRRLRR